MATLIAIVAGAGVIGAFAWALHRAERSRVESLREAAARLGWGFREAVPFETIPDLTRFELFDQGRRRRLANLLTSPAGDVRAVVFDYTYVTGGGKSQQTHRQTVFYATSDALALPGFSLRPQHFLHSIGKAFGYQDIDLEAWPTFSEMFVLRGGDEAAVRAAFTGRVVEFFELRRGVCAAGAGHELLHWRAGRRVAAAELESFIATGYELAQRFSDAR